MTRYTVRPAIHAEQDASLDPKALAVLRTIQKNGMSIEAERVGTLVTGPYAGSPMLEIPNLIMVNPQGEEEHIPFTLFPEVLFASKVETSITDGHGHVRDYLIFVIDVYEAAGGIDDLRGSVNTVAEALELCYAIEASSTFKTKREYQIVNSKTMGLVCRADYDEADIENSWSWTGQ